MSAPAGPAHLPEVPFEPGTRIIGDLHLDVGPGADPGGTEAFLDWLAALVDVPRLVILGDLFDAWIGPAHVSLAAEALSGLEALTRRGTAVDVIPGNRDFLLDAAFEHRSGARLWPFGLVGVDPERAGAGGRMLVIHGDELCTRDLAYQRLRRVMRSGPVGWAAPRIPRPVALWTAGRLRRASIRAVGRKPASEKQQQEPAVRALAAQHGCGTLVCGHAHVFRDEVVPGGPRWVVVGAFGGGLDVLRVGVGGSLTVLEAGARGPRHP
jgi:UDP-2,3-diacylglucosamine hydrolase